LRICKDHKRYEDWTPSPPHLHGDAARTPRLLNVADMPKIVGSGAYFARKFRDTELLKLIDTTLLGVGVTTSDAPVANIA
jgi:hypothetical protein